MHFLLDYGLFLIKLVSSVVAVLILFAGLIAIGSKDKQKSKLSIKHLNKKFKQYALTMIEATQDKGQLKALKNQEKKHKKRHKKRSPHLYVLNFNGDIRANPLNALREEITAILLVADNKHDEVLLRLESGGGLVNAYGLAASQLNRIRSTNLKLTVAVDKVAASGGYMMAAVADHIIAAPFAIIGSIGVIAQIPNFHDLLKHKHIDFEQITAGEYKRTLTVFGKNTDKGRAKMQQDVNETHELFKNHLRHHRPQILMDEVATGEHWFAEKAIEYKLVDELNTSDDYLLTKSANMEIYEVEYKLKKTFVQKIANGSTALWQKIWVSLANKTGQDYLP